MMSNIQSNFAKISLDDLKISTQAIISKIKIIKPKFTEDDVSDQSLVVIPPPDCNKRKGSNCVPTVSTKGNFK